VRVKRTKKGGWDMCLLPLALARATVLQRSVVLQRSAVLQRSIKIQTLIVLSKDAFVTDVEVADLKNGIQIENLFAFGK
jgi:hypothetical protein